ncbi:MAG: DNA-binding protein [Candidatus Omnitrophica bacterium]|nr:DNA-binding protein [Candidatus Omnitrophota bacterium]MCM8771006.1 DNA-binding protein [Candidatus Omnitrophota bacterium]
MIKNFGICIAILLLGFWVWDASYAQPLTVHQLIENAYEYDNQTVIFQGEAIGEIMVRGDFAWVNLHDGEKALGIWMPKEMVKEIHYLGSYKAKGDILEVAGIFHRRCLEHGADMDIHAQAIRKIQAGYAINETADPNKRKITLILVGVLCLTLILQILKKK